VALYFEEKGHRYTSIDITDQIKWISASRIASIFKKPFNAPDQALKASTNKKSKWYGIPQNEILTIWENENLRSTTLGTWYHEKEEARLNGLSSLNYKGVELPIFRSVWDDGKKFAPDQKLINGVYTELLVYLRSVHMCGQFDRVNVYNSIVDIDDHKSNKDLKKPAYVNYEGRSERLLSPLFHLEATKLVEYAIQLSAGMYMILRNNPQLKPGVLTLNYVTFEVDSEDQFGYPIMKVDDNNEPIIKGIEPIQVPYLKREIELILEYLKEKDYNV